MSISREKIWARTLAFTAVGVVCFALAGCSLLGNLANNGGSTGTVSGEGTKADVFTIKVGDCLNDGSAKGDVSTVPTISCAKQHDSEAYASLKMTDSDFPGVDAEAKQATAGCTAQFSGFIGIDYSSSSLSFSYYYPTKSSWAQGDREIICLATDPNGKTTGTLKGAKR
jgi:hypothetical protein